MQKVHSVHAEVDVTWGAQTPLEVIPSCRAGRPGGIKCKVTFAAVGPISVLKVIS